VIRLLSGDEAVARGAWEAGVAVASAYPGTPSTEILEEFARFPNVYAEWATNEKVALDVAIGAAYAGRRAFASMKHVGLNVAADAFMYASMTGMEAGLVIISADDPAMHSSQNEQDNRTFAKFARIPCLEPGDSQEAKDMMVAAFDLSEQFDTPVFLRMTTRLSHSSTVVELGEQRQVRAQHVGALAVRGLAQQQGVGVQQRLVRSVAVAGGDGVLGVHEVPLEALVEEHQRAGGTEGLGRGAEPLDGRVC